MIFQVKGVKMKILVVGSGGREHAIAWRLAQDKEGHELYCAPGNAGTAAVATNVAIAADDIEGIAAWATVNHPDLVVVGPEAPLVKGLVDALQGVGVTAFGPVAAGARMEGSKRFAKEVMDAAGVPTGKAEVFTDAAAAKAALPSFGLPVVIKADGLAAGKGVIVAETTEDAESAIDDMLVGNKFGAAGAEVLIEEFLHGEECSILALVDGENAVLLPSSQDHKRVFDGDKGPNTGGMGAYSPAPVVTADKLPEIKEKIILPVVRELKKRGITYRGVLYAGLMLNDANSNPHGPLAKSGSTVNVVEFNARFGDPETEAVLPRLGGSFATALLHAAKGCLKDEDVVVKDEAAATVIIASDRRLRRISRFLREGQGDFWSRRSGCGWRNRVPLRNPPSSVRLRRGRPGSRDLRWARPERDGHGRDAARSGRQGVCRRREDRLRQDVLPQGHSAPRL